MSDDGLGARLHRRMQRLYPICRSISGAGLRATLDIIGEELDLDRHRVPSGSKVFDWTINDEWNVREAYIARLDGSRVVDFTEHNLHVMSYSTPIDAVLPMAELRPHLHTLPDRPDWIPYRTSYYSRNWAFCLAQRQLDAMQDDAYRVVVDSTIEPGFLDYGELVIPGESDEEVLFSAHVCHPSLANDNLSGIAVAIELAQTLLAQSRRRFSYRFVFAPGTIGSLTWLSRNPMVWPKIKAGLVLTGLGGDGRLVYKRTRDGSAYVDRCLSHVIEGLAGEVRDYSPYGYDERQYNAVGFGLPVGRLSRTPHNEYPEYHTSADDLSFVTEGQLAESYAAVRQVVAVLERDDVFRNLSPYGEPQLGSRGLYPSTGGKAASEAVMAMLWVLGYADEAHSLLDVASLSGLDLDTIADAAERLEAADLLARVPPDPLPVPPFPLPPLSADRSVAVAPLNATLTDEPAAGDR